MSISTYIANFEFDVRIEEFDRPEFRSFMQHLTRKNVEKNTKGQDDRIDLEVVENVESASMEEEFYDEMEEFFYALRESKKQISPEDLPRRELLSSLFLFGRVIKNSELVDDEQLKKSSVRLYVDTFLKFLYSMIVQQITRIDTTSDEEIKRQIALVADSGIVMSNPHNIQSANLDDLRVQARKVVYMFNPLVCQLIMSSILDTPSLELIYREEIDNSENHVSTRLMFTLLYSDLQSRDFINRLNKISKETSNNDFFQEIIEFKLLSYYGTELRREEQAALENLIADITVRRKQLTPQHKSAIIGKLKKRFKAIPETDS